MELPASKSHVHIRLHGKKFTRFFACITRFSVSAGCTSCNEMDSYEISIFSESGNDI